MTPDHSPLGKTVAPSTHYDPSLLFPIERQRARDEIGVPTPLPFLGVDIWNAYELSWLDLRGKPHIALAQVGVPADSPHLVESKSFKLYLGSFAQTKIASSNELCETIARDLSKLCGASVTVKLTFPYEFAQLQMQELEGVLLDRLELETDVYHPSAALLNADFAAAPIEERLVSNLLKSNCPVTGQPDWGTVQIHYVGPPIEHAGLLRYLISYRLHTGFHEQCVERIFMDILRACQPLKLAVYARYTRRGGLDINPFRANFNVSLPNNARTARQ